MKTTFFQKQKEPATLIGKGVQYALFCRVPVRNSGGGLFGVAMGLDEEEWKKEEETNFVTRFICMCDNPKDVAQEIRKCPQLKYFLMSGEIRSIQMNATFFIDGKNLDTLETEWSDLPLPD